MRFPPLVKQVTHVAPTRVKWRGAQAVGSILAIGDDARELHAGVDDLFECLQLPTPKVGRTAPHRIVSVNRLLTTFGARCCVALYLQLAQRSRCQSSIMR